MAAGRTPILDKLHEIERYLEGRKIKAGKEWEHCADFNNRLNDFVTILCHFKAITERATTPTGHTITFSKDSTLPARDSSIWWGMRSNNYRNLRDQLQALIKTNFDAARSEFTTYLGTLHLDTCIEGSIKDSLSSRLEAKFAALESARESDAAMFRTASTTMGVVLPTVTFGPPIPALLDPM